ncbi:hypothetical protein HRbin17_00373 [bacterium HR17]|uniref:LysM domain-containing protein n=1 Tax=Candidatus Fervidibacter japonicus TaxID=2035412 RepID=A0A2H5X9L4_9BACT|nr:hypothetical protein HRbin17_00373 [bacterium HR17]
MMRHATVSWVERAIYWLLIAVLTILLLWQWRTNLPTAIFVNGEPVAWLASECLAQAAVRLALAQLQRKHGRDVTFAETVVTGKLPLRPTAQILAPAEAAELLLRRVRPARVAWVIFVDGRPTLALPSKRDAEQALELVKAALTPRNLPLLRPPRFRERVTVRRSPIAPDLVVPDPEKAARRLVQGSEPPVYHTVRAGEFASHIARRYGVTLEELHRLNPDRDLNRIRIGDQLLVKVGKPLVTVISVHQQVTHEPIPYEVKRQLVPHLTGGTIVTKQRGREGLREVVWEVVCENGREVRRQPVKTRTLRDPVPEILLVGGGLPRSAR